MFVSVPATSANLGPGFDTLGLAINLRNEITIKPSRFFSVSTRGEGSENPHIRKNILFMNIFNKQYQKLKGKRDNFRFEFNNRIPISRGLGSSSAVITAALTASFVASGERYNKRKILNLALEYEPHPDNITPAVMGGFNVACVEEKKVYSKKRKIPEYLRAVLVVPNRTISTAKSRKILPDIYRKDEVVYSLSRSSFMTSLFMTESWDLLKIASKDKLHQTRRMKQVPELFSVQKIALANGALMSTLSGSGSTFFTLCYADDSAKIQETLENNFPKYRVFTKTLDNYGITSKS
ncbi:homoserine kinase [Sulfurovum sp. bin170]|uniref:homoserine kinase n=1 Tax=Sulfurovum sp. bin170 TaxID=2695268 RepID=UPI0013DF067A|nr:homoserine kinase [Sulfurovum sp. bin170]NEW60145.1 homoserine kinase [Sulfurovum sp. bin170]